MAMTFRVVLHSGYPVHARNWPKRPRFIAIGLPQFSHGSISSSPLSDSGSWTSTSRVLVQSGYPLQRCYVILVEVDRHNWPVAAGPQIEQRKQVGSRNVHAFITLPLDVSPECRDSRNRQEGRKAGSTIGGECLATRTRIAKVHDQPEMRVVIAIRRNHGRTNSKITAER